MTLSELRKSKNITSKDLALKLKVSSQAISHYETGKRKMPIKLVKPYAETIGESVEVVLDCLNK